MSVLREDYETSSTTTRTVTPVGDVNMQNSSMALYLTRYENYYEDQMKEQGLLDDTTLRSIRQQIRHRQRILTHRKWSTCLPVQPV